MKEQNKTPEKELNETESIYQMQSSKVVIRMLRELTEYGKSIREEMKATLSEIKKNPQGTNSEGMEAMVQINNLEHKEEKNSQSEQNKETKIFKKEERIRTL